MRFHTPLPAAESPCCVLGRARPNITLKMQNRRRNKRNVGHVSGKKKSAPCASPLPLGTRANATHSPVPFKQSRGGDNGERTVIAASAYQPLRNPSLELLSGDRQWRRLLGTQCCEGWAARGGPARPTLYMTLRHTAT